MPGPAAAGPSQRLAGLFRCALAQSQKTPGNFGARRLGRGLVNDAPGKILLQLVELRLLDSFARRRFAVFGKRGGPAPQGHENGQRSQGGQNGKKDPQCHAVI